MKLKKFVFIVFALLMLTSLSGCKKKVEYEGKTKVIYMLEGGEFKNCNAPIIQYYDVEKEKNLLIFDPIELTNETPIKDDFVFDGWYQSKKEVDGEVVYNNKWDFDANKITSDGVTLYAKWKKNCAYTYNVCYRDENNKDVSLGIYNVSEGEKFYDSSNYSTRIGYTALGYFDENNNPWDENFSHPGGDEDLEVKIYVKYIKGSYAIVRTARELKANKNKNIYLMNDIDFGGDSFSFSDYGHIFEGNGHTISNFKVSYEAGRSALIQDFEDENQSSLCISVFGNIKNATIQYVKFENVHFEIETILSLTSRIYVAGISVSVTNSTIKNVNFSGDYVIIKLPSEFNKEENLVIVSDDIYYLKDKSTTIVDSNGVITEQENIKEEQK